MLREFSRREKHSCNAWLQLQLRIFDPHGSRGGGISANHTLRRCQTNNCDCECLRRSELYNARSKYCCLTWECWHETEAHFDSCRGDMLEALAVTLEAIPSRID